MNENNYTVYMHKNKINGKVYIGITKTKPKYRWNNGKGYNNQYFKKTIRLCQKEEIWCVSRVKNFSVQIKKYVLYCS